MLGNFSGVSYGKGSKFSHQEKLVYSQETEAAPVPKAATEEELREQRAGEVKTLENELELLTSELNALEAAIRKHGSALPQLEARLAALLAANSEREDLYTMRKKVLDLLPNADENIKALQDTADATSELLLALATKWDTVRTELISTFRMLRDAQSDKKHIVKEQLLEIKALRDEMSLLEASSKDKEAKKKQFETDLEKLNKSVHRNSYTRRIMEIVKNIDRQKTDIERVLIDTFGVQKEINQVRERLDRVFHLTDDLIFKTAKTDDASKQAYRNLADLHEYCSKLVTTVEDTGSITREIREIEDQVEEEQRKNMAANLLRISSDYDEMKKENTLLIKEHSLQ